MSDLDKEELEATRNMGKNADELSEKEIIQHFEFIKSGIKEETKFIDISILEYFEGLLDLYNKEKEKVSKYEKQLDLDYVEDNYTPKSLAKEKFKDTRKRILSQTIINDIDKYWMDKCLEYINNLEKELLEDK